MKRLLAIYHDPARLRKALSLGSGALIAMGLALIYGLNLAIPGNILLVAATLLAGWDIARRAFSSLRNRYISIELLVTIAAAGALVIGEYWEAAAVTFLFIFGAYLEARTLSRTRQVLGELLDMAPATATVVRAGQQVQVSPAEVALDEIVWVKPGEKLAVDGVVVNGRSNVDEAAITGEPIPEAKTPGDPVYAGTVNGSALLQVRATGVGADTTLARIIRRVEEAQEERAPTQRFIERFARWYTPAIITLSAGAFLLTRNLELALTLLVIGCPGALVISTPVSVVAGIGGAARKGILIKGGEYLENAGKISALALDKTGTLTTGKPAVTDVVAFEQAEVTEPAVAVAEGVASKKELPPATAGGAGRWSPAEWEVLRVASLVEAGSEHPLAEAILREGAHYHVHGGGAEEFETLPGRGIRARWGDQELLVGSQEWMVELGIDLPDGASSILQSLKDEGKTAVVVAGSGRALGAIGIADPLRESAPRFIKSLRSQGLKRVVMLTGDDERTARAIARQAGIDEVHAGLLPEQKLELVRRLQSEGHVVAMTGDGINDAPALAAADIGIAMGVAGSGVAIETADIALIADDLMRIGDALHISRATLRNIRQNVGVALVTVVLLLGGVLLDRVHMAGGMLVHQASVMVVIFNAMRLLRM